MDNWIQLSVHHSKGSCCHGLAIEGKYYLHWNFRFNVYPTKRNAVKDNFSRTKTILSFSKKKPKKSRTKKHQLLKHLFLFRLFQMPNFLNAPFSWDARFVFYICFIFFLSSDARMWYKNAITGLPVSWQQMQMLEMEFR